jgi:large subunit ribosomal protein L19
MNNQLIKLVEDQYKEKRASLPEFKAGDTINVHVKITEGNKERVQQYQGVVIQRKNGSTMGETFTVRKISNGIGVERIFPLLSPTIDKIEVVRKGSVRRAKLFYLRDKMGKGARIKEDKSGFETAASATKTKAKAKAKPAAAKKK